MATSLFRYQLTRPYPFWWFTPLAIAGLFIFGALFSLLNFAANGYILAVHYSSNPNATLTRDSFATRWPLNAMGKVSGSCEPRDILVGSKFFTNKLSLPYRLESVVRLGSSSEDYEDDVLPSLSYLNNTLEDCSVYNMQIELLAEDRTAAQFGFTQWGPKISASASCFVSTETGRMMLNLSTEYDLIPPTIEDGQQTTLLQRNAKKRASLWWGESLISMYWIQVAEWMQINRDYDRSPIRKGSINLAPLSDVDFTSMGFFSTHYHFNLFRNQDGNIDIFATPTPAETLQTLAEQSFLEDLWAKVDRYGKSFYSTVLADLGQSRGPNLLLPNSTDLLRVYTSEFADFTTKLNAVMGPAKVSYADAMSRSDLGSLQITPSTLYAQYLCQVPVRKPWSELIVAIIVADLVFLRLLWTVCNILATWWVERRDRTAMSCEGDVKRARMEGEEGMGVQSVELVHVGTKGLGRKRGEGGYERFRAVGSE